VSQRAARVSSWEDAYGLASECASRVSDCGGTASASQFKRDLLALSVQGTTAMTLALLLLSLTLPSPADLRAVTDTSKAPPKPLPMAPSTQRGKPVPPPKPVGEPKLKRRKPPGLDLTPF
jgi:hypothetical protein